MSNKGECDKTISKRFAAWDNLNYSEDINRAWENIKEESKPNLNRVYICMN
jgi:hypothetical protein